MHLAQLRLRDFRNYPRLDAEFTPGFHLFLGNNAQGKTNLLEAIYLLATLRSFRGVGDLQMVRHGAKGYFVGGEFVSNAPRQVKMYWGAGQRKLSLDGNVVRRLMDYLGTFRAVVFSSEDWQLIKGPALRRRRFLDLLLSQTVPAYLSLLQRYAQALRARNALLKQRAGEASLEGFSRELIASGEQLMRYRGELLPKLLRLARTAYARIALDREELDLDYQPSAKGDFALELARSRPREQALRTTIVGPHRDDVRATLDGKSAAQFASEGQRRSLVLALKMAQAEYLMETHGAPPVLLLDDILGELDRERRSGFLPLLHRTRVGRGQVFMTATEENWPADLPLEVRRWTVVDGTLLRPLD